MNKKNNWCNKLYNYVILNYFDFPNICYNPSTHHLSFQFKNNQNIPSIKLETQKWNHILVNYNSGNLDIFCNNELSHATNASYINPLNQTNTGIFTTGDNNGIPGSICNLNYYTANNIYLLLINT